MSYIYTKTVRDNPLLRQSFNALSQETFGLDFSSWHAAGYWTDRYIPHVLADGNTVLANVSANVIDMIYNGREKRYIQLGTVMTHPSRRNQGLARQLMEKVLEEYQNCCDTVYLYANDSVIDFYPRFGFVKANEYQSRMAIFPQEPAVRKLDMSKEQDRHLLIRKYGQSNPFSALSGKNNPGLLMFYCMHSMKDCLYFIEKHDAVVIAGYNGCEMLCYNIFCDKHKNIEQILSCAVLPETRTVIFGFSPQHDLASSLLEQQDTTLFIWNRTENIFKDNKLMFPLLSHA